MHGFFLALGDYAEIIRKALNRQSLWPANWVDYAFNPASDICLIRFEPEHKKTDSELICSDDNSIALCLDGCLYTSYNESKSILNQTDHLKKLANTIASNNYNAGYKSIRGGTFNLVVINLEKHECYITTDHTGSIPLYHCINGSNCLISTNPVVIANSGLTKGAIDMTALAEYVFVGYTIGTRYMFKDIKTFIPNTTFHWKDKGCESRFIENADNPYAILPDGDSPNINEIVDGFINSCQQISNLDPSPAHFQSSGKDSRLILAAWPNGYSPPCYTYGNIKSHEINIAKTISRVRGSKWIHSNPSGDEAAECIEDMCNCAGSIVFPDRYFAAREIAADGHTGVLDGYMGGVYMGSDAFGKANCFSIYARIAYYLTKFIDHSLNNVSLDQLTHTLYDTIQEIRDKSMLPSYLSEDFITELKKEQATICQDIYSELKRLKPENNSLGILWRNFLTYNRLTHATIMQGVMCRAFINVYYPYASDLNFLKAQMRITLEDSSCSRPYIKIFRKWYPSYGKIPHGATLCSLNKSPFWHKTSGILVARNVYIPFLSPRVNGMERDANSWGTWLRESADLRNVAGNYLRQAGIANSDKIEIEFDKISKGEKTGTGKLFHLASIAKWISLSHNA